MNIVDKIMNALSLYDEEEILEDEPEKEPAKQEQPKKRQSFFSKKEAATQEAEPKRERSTVLPFKMHNTEATEPKTAEADKPKQMRGKTIELPIADKMMTVVVLEPADFNDSQKVADYLRNNQPVVVNFGNTDNIVAKRMTDFVSGTVYALGGTMKKIGRNILICAPKNVDIDAGAEHEEDVERGNNPWDK
jgi:cell division inhibitor SepF